MPVKHEVQFRNYLLWEKNKQNVLKDNCKGSASCSLLGRALLWHSGRNYNILMWFITSQLGPLTRKAVQQNLLAFSLACKIHALSQGLWLTKDSMFMLFPFMLFLTPLLIFKQSNHTPKYFRIIKVGCSLLAFLGTGTAFLEQLMVRENNFILIPK